METTLNQAMKEHGRLGAIGGLIVYAILGALPSLYVSSFGTVALLAWVTGSALEPSLLTRALIVIGSAAGFFIGAGIFALAGVAVGLAVGSVSEIWQEHKETQAKELTK